MVTVDSKGRIVLPQDIRERLGITPGSEVEVREKEGKAVVEPEDDPEAILQRMDRLVEETASERRDAEPIGKDVDPGSVQISWFHAKANDLSQSSAVSAAA